MKLQTEPGSRPKRPEAILVDDAHFDARAAADQLRQGNLVGIPTETVYGLGADATSAMACARIYEAKGRPRFNPLIAHCATLAMAMEHGEFSPMARALAEAFWPGPLTLVVERRAGSSIADLVTAGLDTVALRVPGATIMRRLIEALGAPIAAPSANRSGHVSATTAEAVAEDLGDAVAMIVDAGPSPLGLESTIVDVSGPVPILLRPGALSRAEIEAMLGHPLSDGDEGPGDRLAAPGMLASHYAPSCPVRMNADTVGPGEGLLAFGTGFSGDAAEAARVINLSPDGDLREAAANLFSALRRLDAAGVSAIAVAPIPETGLGEAINDRLRRASVGREPRS